MAETSFAWQTELTAARPHEAVAAADDARSPLERQAAVLTLLRSRSGAAPLSAQAIAHQLGADRVDLDEDAQVHHPRGISCEGRGTAADAARIVRGEQVQGTGRGTAADATWTIRGVRSPKDRSRHRRGWDRPWGGHLLVSTPARGAAAAS